MGGNVLSEKISWKLYALSLTMEHADTASKYRFFRITPAPEPGYVLIYTRDGTPEDAEELGEEEQYRLTGADERWLYDCNMALLMEDALAREAEIVSSIARRMDALETALREKKAGERIAAPLRSSQ